MPETPGYVRDVLDLAAELARPGAVAGLFVLHDAHCALLADRGPCNCAPTVTAGVTLWHRRGRRHAWEMICTVANDREAWEAVAKSGKRNGDWVVLPSGRQP